MKRVLVFPVAAAGLVLFLAPVHLTLGEGPTQKLPEGPGLAAKLGGTEKLLGHPDVVLVEDFEVRQESDLNKRWTQISHPEIMKFSDDAPPDSDGKRSLLMTHIGGKGTGGHLYRRLDQGYERLFIRFYVKFAQDCGQIHHFFHVGGYNPPTPWPQGGAGERPRGNERFTVGVEPFGTAWRWDYYTYWMEMRGSPPRGQTWGNCFVNDPNLHVKKGQWQCLEVMIKLNSPVTESNGELALWVDGRLVSHLGPGFPKGKWTYDRFLPGQGGQSIRWNDEKGGPETFSVPEGGVPFSGFRWRNDENLKINFVWVLLYITKTPEGAISQVWFDDIVAAKSYIGPNK